MVKLYDVYLEIAESGECMVHAPQLPGCLVRAHSKEAALAKLPSAIRSYRDWLRRHDEQADEVVDKISWQVAASFTNVGAFEPGQKATLFEWEKVPLSRNEMEQLLRPAAYNRTDLLSLVRPLSPAVRRWRAEPDQMNIDQILIHLGLSEQWYVSRLAKPGSFDMVRIDDTDLTPMAYLQQSRERAQAHLRKLTDEALANVFYPAQFTDHPDEPWNARKVVRRLLEHEREHIDQIQDILAQWRKHLLARIAAERAYLLWGLRSLDEKTLSDLPVTGSLSAKDLLVHVGIWDAVQTERIELVSSGRLDQIRPVGGPDEMDARNAEIHRLYRDIPLEQAVAVCLKERGGFLRMLARLSDEAMHRQIRLPWGWRTRMRVWAMWRHRHDASHAAELEQWRQRLPRDLRRQAGPKYIMPAILRAARKEFLTVAALVPAWQRDSRPVCGVWTLKDLVGHLTDWEQVGLSGLQQLAAGQLPEFETAIIDFDSFNNANAAVRRDQPWSDVWAEFNETRQLLMEALEQMTQEALSRTFVTPWKTTISAYVWALIWPGHEREHAIDVRRALQMTRLPKRLRQPH